MSRIYVPKNYRPDELVDAINELAKYMERAKAEALIKSLYKNNWRVVKAGQRYE